ncbi:MAG TPA: 50S ribosomal protein L10 [Thermoplasmatales archaeon]|nr:50S ribosomal protein L10 [Thermoplasmatales archaeon]
MPAQAKIEEVQNLKELISSYPVIGIVSIHGIPASQMHAMRKMLRDHAVVRVSKNRLIKHALSDQNGMSKLADYLEGESAILATDVNPFKIYRELEKAKMRVPAKGGEIAPQDIVVEKGKTAFKPGPIVGELQQVGIPAAIREGGIVIDRTVTVVKEGQVIPPEKAQMLTRLEIYPLEVGLDVQAVYEDGSIYTADVLDVDLEDIINDFRTAASRALALAVEVGYPTRETVPLLLQKAHRHSLALALEAGVVTPETVKEFIARAHRQASTLAKELKTEGE